jgi:branched-chain amino acid transport system permease protein
MALKKYMPILILIGSVIFIQLLTLVTGTSFILTQLTMAAYYGLAIIGLCILMGYTGQISIGHAAFFAIGGYVNALLTTRNIAAFGEQPFVKLITHLHLTVTTTDLYGNPLVYIDPRIALIISLCCAVLMAVIIGIPILKLKGHYLAMATLAFGVIIQKILIGSSLFGEADGISGVPAFPIIPGLKISGDSGLKVQNFYIAWTLVCLGMLLLTNLISSRPGRALRAIHGNEEAAASTGVDTGGYKLGVFVLSAVFAALGGALMTHYNGGIGPSEASVMKSVRYVAIVAIGGMSNIWGALIIGTILNFLSLRGVFGSYNEAVFGVIMILIIMFIPEGLFKNGLPAFLKRKHVNPADQ